MGKVYMSGSSGSSDANIYPQTGSAGNDGDSSGASANQGTPTIEQGLKRTKKQFNLYPEQIEWTRLRALADKKMPSQFMRDLIFEKMS